MVRATAGSFATSLIRSRTEQAQQARIVIFRGSLGVLDRSTGLVGGLDGAQVIYRGQARIHPVSGGRTVSGGGGEIVQRDTVVSIPVDATPLPQRDDVIYVGSDDPGDATLATLTLWVMAVDGGGYFGDARRLTCAGYGRSRSWNPA